MKIDNSHINTATIEAVKAYRDLRTWCVDTLLLRSMWKSLFIGHKTVLFADQQEENPEGFQCGEACSIGGYRDVAL